MARSLSQTLIRSPISFLFSSRCRNGVCLVSSRQYSFHSKSRYEVVDSSSSEVEALAIRSIEDAIHGIVVKRLTPDWLPFVPGASFWVPPKPTNYGVAEMIHKIACTSAVSDDEVMSLTTFFGWPSSEFFIQGMLLLFLFWLCIYIYSNLFEFL